MFTHPHICIARFVSPWGMMIGIVGLKTSCTKGQDTYTKYKVKYSNKEALHSTIIQDEETSILMVDSKDEEEEVWVEAENRSSITTAHN
jgi:hypothetical protein